MGVAALAAGAGAEGADALGIVVTGVVPALTICASTGGKGGGWMSAATATGELAPVIVAL